MNSIERYEENTIKAVIEGIKDPVLILTGEGNIFSLNESARNIIGFKKEQKGISDYLYKETTILLLNLFKKNKSVEKIIEVENFPIGLKSGEKFNATVNLKEIELNDNAYYLCTISPLNYSLNLINRSSISFYDRPVDEIVSNPKLKFILDKISSSYPLTFIGKESLSKLADELDELFWLKDFHGNYILVNKRFANSLRLEKFRIEGKNFNEFVPSFLVNYYKELYYYLSETLNYVSISGTPVQWMNLSDEEEIMEIPLTDLDKKVVAVVGFTLNRKKLSNDISEDQKQGLIFEYSGLLPLPAAIINKYGHFRHSNEEFCKLLGRKSNELEGQKITDVFPIAVTMAVNDFIQSISDGIIIEIDENWEINKESETYFKIYLSRIPGSKLNEENISISITRTGYIFSLQELIKRKGRMFDTLIKNNPEPIFIYDKDNLRFLEVNNSALELYGYSRDEFLQMDLTDLYSPEDIQTLLETSDEILKEGEFSKPFRHRRKDGSFIFVRISKIGFKYDERDSHFNIIRDVTDNLELEKKNQLFKSAFENTSDMLFITEPSGIIIYSNDSASRILGIPKPALLNTSLASHCIDEDRMILNSSVFQSHLKEPVTITVKLKTSASNVFEAELISTPVLDLKGEVESFSILVKTQAQTEIIPAEPKEIIREVIKEVIVEKPVMVESAGPQLNTNFLSGVFHEILTPMNVILGFAQELTESIEHLSPEQKEAVDIINQNRSALLGLMNSIIEFSEHQLKNSGQELSEVSITEIIEQLDNNIRDITGSRDVEFAYGKISSSLKFVTDKKKFESLVNNLVRMVTRLTNQKKIYFSAYPVGESSFIISVSDKFAQASASLVDNFKKLFLEFKDAKEVGISRFNFQITQSLLESLNGSFTTFGDSNKKQECAFKFPLQLTKEILQENLEIEIHEEPEVEEKISQKEPEHFIARDEIEIEEEHVIEPVKFENEIIEAGGTNTELEPVVEEEISVEEAVHPRNHLDLSYLSCLYIEDQLDSQILFKVQMKGLKDIQFAASFEEALPLLDNNKFDFIVMDINLQGEYNGLDALKIIHQMPALEEVPIIAVTAYVLPGDREKFIATGFNDFISKPIFREKMIESLKKIFTN